MDTARHVAFNPDAPQDERNSALAELQQAHMPTRSDLLPVGELIKFAEKVRLEQPLVKAANVLDGRKPAKRGPQSVMLDEWTAQRGNYYDPPGILSYSMMRSMVERTPVLSAAIMTRVRQARRFCQVAQDDGEPGFRVQHRDKNHEPDKTEEQSIALLQNFLMNSGWEANPFKRDALGRFAFGDMMAQLVEDSLTLDSCAIEIEYRQDKRSADGLYVVDGSTIRLCSEEGYDGDDSIYAVQVINGNVATGYAREDLICRPRNPVSSIFRGGYGKSEVELMVEVVTGFLNAMTLNIAGFNQNEVPPGLLLLSGNFGQDDLDAFRRYLNNMMAGPKNRFRLPFMSSKDQEAAASFVKLGDEFNEMYFSKWMTFLVSIICALFGMSPDEINFEAFSAGRSSLSGSDTAEKLADSKDKGLRPLLSYFEQLLSTYIIQPFSEKYVFAWTGLEERDEEKQHELNKLAWTFNEVRQNQGLDPIDGPLGDCPVNPSMVGPWLQLMQAQAGDPGDFGQPDEEQAPDEQAPQDSPPEDAQAAEEQQAGGQADFGGDADDGEQQPYGQPADFGKSLIWSI